MPSLEQYELGGGIIEPGEWYDAYQRGENAFFKGSLIKDLEQETMIVRHYFEVVDIDYAGKYHLTATVGYFDLATESWETKFVSTNMDEITSREDWEMEMVRALMETEISPRIDWEQGVSFWDYLAEERM